MDDGLQETVLEGRRDGERAGSRAAEAEGYPMGYEAGYGVGSTLGILLQSAISLPADPKRDKLIADLVEFPLENIIDTACDGKQVRLSRLQARLKELSTLSGVNIIKTPEAKYSF